MNPITRIFICFLLLLPELTLAQPGVDKTSPTRINDKSLFDLANHFNNYLGILFEEKDFLYLSEGVRQLDSLEHFVGVNSGYSMLSLQETENQSILEAGSVNNMFLAGFVPDGRGGVGLNFYVFINNELFSEQESIFYSEYIEDEVERFYNNEQKGVKSTVNAIAYGIQVYLDIILERNEFMPAIFEADDLNLGDHTETFKNGRTVTSSPYIYFEDQTTFMGLAGVPIPLPSKAYATFYPVGHKYEGCLRSFTLDREIDSSNGSDSRGIYKPLVYVSGPYAGKFAGYGYLAVPTEGTSTKYKRYSYSEFVEKPKRIGFPSYAIEQVVGVTRGVISSCIEGRVSSKLYTKTNNYLVNVLDLSDTEVNPSFTVSADRLIHLGVNDFMLAGEIFENYSNTFSTWDNSFNVTVAVDQTRDVTAKSYSCIADSLINETHVNSAIENGQSYITKLRDQSLAIIAVVEGKQYYVYQPFSDQQEVEYMVYHEFFGWVDVDAIHDQTVNDFVNAMIYVGRIIAVTTFVIANIVIGNIAAGMAIYAYGSTAGVLASVGVDFVFAGIEGGVILFITDDPEKARTAFILGAGGSLAGTGLEVLAQRAVRSFSKFRFGKKIGESTEGFDAIIKIKRGDGTEISRSLRKFSNDLRSENILSDDRIKILFDEMNSNAKFTNFVLSSEGFDGVRAWEVLASSNKEAARLLRTDVNRLEDLSRFMANNPSDVSRIISELNLPNTHVGQYLDYVKYVGTDLEHFYTTFRLYKDSEGRSWQEYLNWANNSNAFKVGLPPYQGKTYEEVMDIVLQSDRYSHMTKSDAQIAFSYTTGYFYKTVNDWIRAGEEVVLSQQIMGGVLPSLAKLPKYEPSSTFYRAIEVKPENLSAFLDEYIAGADVSKDFIQSIATREADSFIGRRDHNIEFEIRGLTSSSSEARDIHDFAWAKYWNTTNPAFPRTLSEGVLMPGANVRVVELKSESNGIYRFILEEF